MRIQITMKKKLRKVFEEYLPDYHDARLKNDPLKVKNLYTIYPDICVTNRSAYQVKDLLLLNFYKTSTFP